MSRPRFIRKFTKPPRHPGASKHRRPIRETSDIVSIPQPKEAKPTKKKKNNIIPVILAILIILFIAALVNKKDSEKVEGKLIMVEENVTLTRYIPKSISLEKELEEIEEYKFRSITLIGRVISQLEGTKGAGTIEYYLIDDSKNKIRLTTLNKETYLEIKNAVFNSGSNPNLVFNVTGTVKRTFGDYYIEVKKIVESERPMKLVRIKTEKKPEVEDEKSYFDVKIDSLKKEFSEVIEKIKGESKDLYEKAREESKEKYGEVISEVDEFFEVEEVIDVSYAEVKERPAIKIAYTPYSSEEDSKEAIGYVNELRKSNGKKSIKFDERVYKLALARAKDMSENKYLDHTNPQTGECPDNMKKEFGLSPNEYVAENAYGDPNFQLWSSSEIEAIDSWMGSRGHRYNLMYNTHIGGAVACYRSMCTFLGLNHDMFGMGCHTGEEGMAYWATAPIQPGEI